MNIDKYRKDGKAHWVIDLPRFWWTVAGGISIISILANFVR